LSNNRGNNNRRRGRGGNNRQQSGPVNRIDSRARGNAPQMLDKFKKLAHDASMNGDRVQAEYYLQFADHYFRVIADSRTVKDEPRRGRDDEREQNSDDDFRDDEDGDEAYRRYAPRPQPQQRYEEAEEEPVAAAAEITDGMANGVVNGGDERRYEPDANPFVREKKIRARRPRRDERDEAGAEADDEGSKGLDPSILPPSIAGEADVSEDRPRARRHAPRKRPSDGEGETLEVVN
jgi:hypothetical protein